MLPAEHAERGAIKEEISKTMKHTAMMIDLENIYYFLKDQIALTEEGAQNASIDVISYLLNEISQKQGDRVTIGRAFLDMDRTQLEVRRLAYLGIKPEHVTSTPQKSSADIELSLEAMATMYGTPECDTFYIVGGDRDYLQICRRLRENLKTVYVAGFDKALSADLREYVGQKSVILCDKMFDASAYPTAQPAKPAPVMAPPLPIAAAAPASSSPAVAPPKTNLNGNSLVNGRLWPNYKPEETDYDWEERAMLALLRFQESKKVKEIWLSPFFYKLDADEGFALISQRERRSLITSLDRIGAIRVEQRQGDQGKTFSVAHIRMDHPLTRKVLES